MTQTHVATVFGQNRYIIEPEPNDRGKAKMIAELLLLCCQTAGLTDGRSHNIQLELNDRLERVDDKTVASLLEKIGGVLNGDNLAAALDDYGRPEPVG